MLGYIWAHLSSHHCENLRFSLSQKQSSRSSEKISSHMQETKFWRRCFIDVSLNIFSVKYGYMQRLHISYSVLPKWKGCTYLVQYCCSQDVFIGHGCDVFIPFVEGCTIFRRYGVLKSGFSHVQLMPNTVQQCQYNSSRKPGGHIGSTA
jgi:hypothetical protein